MTALLKTSGLHCGYGADEIIHGVDLEVARGEIEIGRASCRERVCT